MELPANTPLSTVLLTSLWIVWFVILLAAAHGLWRAWKPDLRHLYPASTLGIFLLWQLAAIPTGGLGFHFLGLTVYTLMFGWAPAIFGASAVILGQALDQGGNYAMLAPNALILGILPVTLSDLIRRVVYRYLPHHLFIYLLVVGFFGAIVSTGITVLVFSGALVVTDTYTLAWLAEQYLPYLPLFLLPEGVLNGMLTTVLVGLRPAWLVSFDDDTYLR